MQSTVSLPVVQYGDNGLLVRKVQAILGTMGYIVNHDGDYGMLTKHCVENLQRVKGLPETGVVDAKTWEALLS